MMYFARWKVIAIWAVCVLGILLSLPNLFSKQQLEKLPAWVPHRTFTLGLDLQGGSYLLLEIDMQAVVRDRLETLVDSVRTKLRTDNINVTNAEVADRSVRVTLQDPAQANAAVRSLQDLVAPTPANASLGGNARDIDVVAAGNQVSLTLTEVGLRDKATQAVEQSIEIVRRRIDETGVNEPSIARQGADRILVQLPGVEDPDRIKRLLGTTAKMTFRLVDLNGPGAGGRPPPGSEFLPADGQRQPNGQPAQYLVRKRIEVEGANLTNARASLNQQTSEWVVNFEFDSTGAKRFADVTTTNVGRPFAIVLDNKVLSAPNIREPITGGRGQISGSFTAASANDLAVMLRAGALPAPLKIVEERTVGPDLGADAIRAGLISCIVGLLLVCVYMALSYGIFGLFADIAVIFNLLLTLGALSLLQATLTLPGIAGLLLGVGLSVDANVLINERVREETKRGRPPFSAMQTGFTRAYSTIVDANLTTLIKMFLLYTFGSGAIRGFAVTIGIGILISMFTATVVVRLMMVTWLRRRRPTVLAV